MTCRWNGTHRILPDHHQPDCAGDCRGCQPCPERHCVVCRRIHAPNACAECVTETRNNLNTIHQLATTLPEEAEHRGVSGEAMMLLGPTANPEAWAHQAMSAMMGRIDASYLDDNHDEHHPLWVTGTWAERWRIHRGHHTDLDLTLTRSIDYLQQQMHYMAEVEDPDFAQFAKEIRACRTYLEDVLHAGDRPERGAPCVTCERTMTRVHDAKTGFQDAYHCAGCRRTVTGDQYRYAIGAAYRAVAKQLTAADIAERVGVKASVIRVWGARGQIRKRGRNSDGITLYDVADAEARANKETA